MFRLVIRATVLCRLTSVLVRMTFDGSAGHMDFDPSVSCPDEVVNDSFASYSLLRARINPFKL
jgi:hypothetical protein